MLARNLEPETSDRIRELSHGDAPKLSGLLLEPEQVRLYPQAGGGPDDVAGRPPAGLREPRGRRASTASSSTTRTPSPGCRRWSRRRRMRAATPCRTPRPSSRPGIRARTSPSRIDASLQVAVEQELLAAWIADRAKRVSAVVLDPYSGEVYAYASYPSYDANDYQAIAAESPGRFIDPIVSTVYEPGSVFKMMTVDRGRGRRRRHHEDEDQGHRHAQARRGPGTRRQRGSQGDGRDDVRGRDRVLAQRRRGEGGAQARQDDRRRRRPGCTRTWRTLGFGSATGIDVANEVPGIVQRPGRDAVAADRPRERRPSARAWR